VPLPVAKLTKFSFLVGVLAAMPDEEEEEEKEEEEEADSMPSTTPRTRPTTS
jgi:hypothetical protein